MYAIVQIAGKQFKVKENDTLFVPRLKADAGDSITFEDVLLVGGDDIRIGTPNVAGATVTATVKDHVKGDKIIVFKRKRRKGYRKKQGHRQDFTEIRIDEVALA